MLCARRPRDELAIEVVWTSGGIDTLQIYEGLGVPEVWVWREGKMEVFALRNGKYEARSQCVLLPSLDLELLAQLAELKNQSAAVKAWRAALRGA